MNDADGTTSAAPAVSDTGPPPRGRSPLLWSLAAGALGLVVLSIVLVVAAGDPGRFPEGSPERVVQRFVEASIDGDRDQAASLVVDRSAGGEPICDLVTAGRDADARVVLVRTEREGDRAVVTVRISQIRGFGLFGPDESAFEDRFELRRDGGTWRLTSVPWPFATCEYEVVGP